MPRERVDEAADRLEAAGADFVIITYGGARHSFTNIDAGAAGNEALRYDERADRRSWTALRDFFAEVLA